MNSEQAIQNFTQEISATQLYLRAGFSSPAQASFFLICASDSMGAGYVALDERNYKRTFLVYMNKIVFQSCTMSSVDVTCVSDIIFRFNIFLINNILPLFQQYLLSEYRCPRVCLKRNVMEHLICQISILNLIFSQLSYFQAKNPVFIVKTCFDTIVRIFCYLLLFCLDFQDLFVLYYE